MTGLDGAGRPTVDPPQLTTPDQPSVVPPDSPPSTPAPVDVAVGGDAVGWIGRRRRGADDDGLERRERAAAAPSAGPT